jgi:hypothetical protein
MNCQGLYGAARFYLCFFLSSFFLFYLQLQKLENISQDKSPKPLRSKSSDPESITNNQLWQWFLSCGPDLVTHIGGKEINLLTTIPSRSRDLTTSDWDLLRKVHLQYTMFRNSPLTRSQFVASKPLQFQNTKETALDLD